MGEIGLDHPLFDSIVNLGTKNSKTLGHFPKGAFQEHARKRYIIGAYKRESKELLGYVLFAITASKAIVRIVQLCIAKDHRKKGIATMLLDEVRNKFSLQLKGISLSCREDYLDATEFWKKYGFVAKNRVRSRSKKEHYLVKWWYDFGNQDLFSLFNENSEKIKALLDTNMIIKLRDDVSNEQTGAKYLMADWLVDEVDYYFASEFYNEIHRDKDKDRASKSRSFITQFCETKFKPEKRNEIFNQLRIIIDGKTANDVSDKRQLSECIAAGIGYFITTDTDLLNADEKIFERYGVQILTPTDFILMLDQINNRSNYISTRIAGVNVEYKQLESKEIATLISCFLRKNQGEKKFALREALTSITGNVKTAKVKVIKNSAGTKLGFWCAELSTNALIVPLIRTTETRFSAVLFKQLVFDLINYAVDHQKSVIKIHDNHLGVTDKETLETSGFFLENEVWTKIALTGIVRSVNILSDKRIPKGFSKNESLKEKLKQAPNSFIYSMERLFWPVKLSNLDIPVYIIPIKPYWAGQLFDHYRSNTSLFGAPAELAWNRENVYYRSVKPVSEHAPARILWYSSRSTNPNNLNRSQAIVGCSYLDEVHIGTSKSLYQKFKNYGIYEWQDVFNLAKNDLNRHIKVIKFSDTEVFKNAVPLTEIDQILINNGRKKNTFASPVRVNSEIFLEIYQQGTQLEQ